MRPKDVKKNRMLDELLPALLSDYHKERIISASWVLENEARSLIVTDVLRASHLANMEFEIVSAEEIDLIETYLKERVDWVVKHVSGKAGKEVLV